MSDGLNADWVPDECLQVFQLKTQGKFALIYDNPKRKTGEILNVSESIDFSVKDEHGVDRSIAHKFTKKKVGKYKAYISKKMDEPFDVKVEFKGNDESIAYVRSICNYVGWNDSTLNTTRKESTEDSVVIRWVKPVGCADNLFLHFKTFGIPFANQLRFEVNANKEIVKIPDLLSNTEYNFEVVAVLHRAPFVNTNEIASSKGFVKAYTTTVKNGPQKAENNNDKYRGYGMKKYEAIVTKNLAIDNIGTQILRLVKGSVYEIPNIYVDKFKKEVFETYFKPYKEKAVSDADKKDKALNPSSKEDKALKGGENK